jgi:hypothetical protein
VNKRLILIALIAIPLLRIIATYTVFSQTSDEPAHIAAGFEWLTTGRYDLDAEHPPLARILFGVDAALSGAKPGGDYGPAIGNALLERDGRYLRNLAAARAGNLPFFLLALGIVGLWTRRLFGDAAALIALALSLRSWVTPAWPRPTWPPQPRRSPLSTSSRDGWSSRRGGTPFFSPSPAVPDCCRSFRSSSFFRWRRW